MSHRVAKVNKEIQRLLGEIILQEVDIPAGTLVTIVQVETAPKLTSALVWLSIFPIEQSAAVMEILQTNLYQLQKSLYRQLRLYPRPRLTLKLDQGGAHADKIERVLRQL